MVADVQQAVEVATLHDAQPSIASLKARGAAAAHTTNVARQHCCGGLQAAIGCGTADADAHSATTDADACNGDRYKAW